MICKDCKKDTPKLNSGRRTKRGKIIYITDDNKQWHGTRCPSCWSKYVSYRLKINQQTVEGFEIPVYHSERKCGKCCGKLELARWKKCFKCEPPETRPSDAWYEISYSVAL